MVVGWNNLTLTQARGWILHYTIHYWDVGNQNRFSARNFSTKGVATSHTFNSGFDASRTYNIVITATTIAGEGVDSKVFVLVGRPLPSGSNQPGM